VRLRDLVRCDQLDNGFFQQLPLPRTSRLATSNSPQLCCIGGIDTGGLRE
jgi:hypothetical protein